jgi:Ca-activated chloride channel family protein
MGAAIMIEFARPYIFLLIPLPWLVQRFLSHSNGVASASLKVPSWDDVASFQYSGSGSIPKMKGVWIFFIWLALITAAARPQYVGEMVEISQTGRDLMLAVDLSGSMRTEDFEIKGRKIDRLSALKIIVSDFIERRQGDRVGLILFGARAYLQVPLTFDLATVKQLLVESAVGLAGNQTAIGDAIGLAVKRLRDSPHDSRVLVLLTDGNSNAGELSVEKAAELASHAQLKIHTVAIGAKEMIVSSFFGSQRINPSADIDEESLKMIAEKTGGQYFRAYKTEELAEIYRHIDSLEKIERASQFYRPTDEMYPWPLAASLLGLSMLMSYSWIQRRLA